jgi:hypothetical protein
MSFKQNETSLAVVRDVNNTVVTLGGQAVAPESSAKCIGTKKLKWFTLMQRECQNPKGMVYQVWALKLNPLTPTSIGLLDKFDDNNQRILLLTIQEKPSQLH